MPLVHTLPLIHIGHPARAAGKFTRQYIDNTVPAMAFGEFWDTCDYTDGVLNYNQDTHRQVGLSLNVLVSLNEARDMTVAPEV